jgi:hypothetical protein
MAAGLIFGRALQADFNQKRSAKSNRLPVEGLIEVRS